MIAESGSKTTGKNQTTMELEGDRGIVITRTFNAPQRVVFDAYTKPEFVRRWWAPKSLGVTIVSCDADVTVGGNYRYVLKPRDGHEFAFSGKYTEVTPHSRVAYTQIFEPMADGGEATVTATFEDLGEKTRLVSHALYPSKQVREMVLASGMEHGMRETMDLLDELVASLA